MHKIEHIIIYISFLSLLIIQGCTGVGTFPTIARSGDTVAMMMGSSEQVRKDTISVELTDRLEGYWDLQALGKVRSVFNLRAEGRANGTHYSPYLESYIPWTSGHEPLQTVLVIDIPEGVSPGMATLIVNAPVTDNSSGINYPINLSIEIIPGSGTPDQFLRQTITGASAVDFERLEPAPHAKISFETAPLEKIYAASLIVSFNNSLVNGDDINIYVPESTVRGTFSNPGAFGDTQRMVFWKRTGNLMKINVIAPQGIDPRFLHVYLIHPNTVSDSPNFSLDSAVFYDADGEETTLASAGLEYFQ